MWSVQQTCKLGRRAAGFLGGLLVALLVAAGPAAGVTFSDPMTLSNGGVAGTPAVVVTSSGQIYAAWKEGADIFFTRSLPSRGSCGGPGRLEFQTPAENISRVNAALVSTAVPSIAASGSGVFVVWQEVPVGGTTGGVQAIRFARSIDGGVTFASQPLDFNRFVPVFPSVAADSGGVFVVWQDFVGGKTSVLVAQSLDGGTGFTYGNVTANRRFSSTRASVASDGSKVHVVWRESGFVWYKGFARGSNQAALDSAGAAQLTTASVLHPPKIGVDGTQVTAAWLEGLNIRARSATNGNFDLLAPPETLYSSSMALSSLSLSLGGVGRFFAWQEADFSIRYLLGTAAGTLRSSSAATNPAAPSVGQDGTDRLVATWQENGTASTETRLAHTGGSGGGAPPMNALVEMTPQTLNAKTMYQGEGVFTLRIQLPNGNAGDIDLASLKINGQTVPVLRSSLSDTDGNGTPDTLDLKFQRRDLRYVFDGATLAAAQRDGNYTVTGNTSDGCFSGSGSVRILR